MKYPDHHLPSILRFNKIMAKESWKLLWPYIIEISRDTSRKRPTGISVCIKKNYFYTKLFLTRFRNSFLLPNRVINRSDIVQNNVIGNDIGRTY
jgi:hypothetical protein